MKPMKHCSVETCNSTILLTTEALDWWPKIKKVYSPNPNVLIVNYNVANIPPPAERNKVSIYIHECGNTAISGCNNSQADDKHNPKDDDVTNDLSKQK